MNTRQAMRLANWVAVAGSDVTGMGGYLICAPGCGERRSLSPEQIAKYLRHGWPLHCGRTMQWITAKQALAEHRAPELGGPAPQESA